MSALLHDPGPLAPALRWVDRRFGPIRSLEALRQGPFWLYAARLARAPVGTLHQPDEHSSCGCSLSGDEALRRVLGEAVERLVGFELPPEAALRRGRLSPALAARLPRCADDEDCAPWARAAPAHLAAEPLLLATMTRLLDGAPVEVPAPFAYPVLAGARGEPTVASAISTGLAFHVGAVAATFAGLCELIERDAVVTAWWAQRPGPRLAFDGGEPPALAARLAAVAALGLRPTVWTLPSALGLPAVLCALRGAGYPRLTSGASAHPEPAVAVVKALDEAVSLRHHLAVGEAAPCPAAPSEVRTLADHARVYALGRFPEAFAAFDAAPARAFAGWAAEVRGEVPGDEAALAAVAGRLATEGLTLLARDLTTPEAAPLGRVVRVAVPELVPLSPDHRQRWLASPRLAARAGLAGPARVHHLHPYPVPLA